MFQAQNRETINSTLNVSVTVLKGHYDDERNKTMFHIKRPARPRHIFGPQTGVVRRPTVSDHITVINIIIHRRNHHLHHHASSSSLHASPINPIVLCSDNVVYKY